MKNTVFIACSLDGYIADKNGEISWLESVPNPEQQDLGFVKLLEDVDAVLMGRNTFEVVSAFDGPWPYPKPVIVLSNSLTEVEERHQAKVELVRGSANEVLTQLNSKGYTKLYIDGGVTIQHFLKADLITDLVVTRFPILLGGGAPLFGSLDKAQTWKLQNSQILLGQLVQSHYSRT